ncbi:MAG: hypothetical protein ACOYLU_16015, partial [Limisphaerales bacterium]
MSDPVPPQPVEGKNTSAGRPRPWYRLALLLAVVLFIPSVRKHLPGWTQNKKFDQEIAQAIDQALREELGNKPLPVLKREAAEILPTGLDTEQLRETWHRTPEGSDVFPVALLLALKDPSSG